MSRAIQRNDIFQLDGYRWNRRREPDKPLITQLKKELHEMKKELNNKREEIENNKKQYYYYYNKYKKL